MSDPRLVAIGGGHGLARTLGAARRITGELTAIVSVADDGGSSGRLRAALGVPAPGDVRKCLGALLPEPSPLGDALEHRFVAGELEGHAFGNLLLAALGATTGSFAAGVAEACRLLRTVGTVIPATEVPVDLVAQTDRGAVTGQVAINATPGVLRVHTEPAGAPVPASALAAIGSADLVVIGPGSLYTSVLAACAPPPIAAALGATAARRVYVANLREQAVETAGYSLADHLAALERAGIVPEVALVDARSMPIGQLSGETEVLDRPLARPHGLAHDEELLAEAIGEILDPVRHR